MPLFKFKVADSTGRVQEILVEGDNQPDATRRVQARGSIPIEFLGISDNASQAGPTFRFAKKFDAAEFTDRLVPLLEADIALEKALAIVEDTSELPVERDIIAGLRRGLHEGRRFSQLIRNRSQYFPRMYASIVEAGEEAGALPQVLAQLRDFMAMTREMKNFLISASIYPFFVMVVCLGVVVTLLGVVVPKFATVLVGANREPSAGTQFLLAMSGLMRDYWWVGPIVVVAILLVIREIMVNEGPLREWWDDFILRVPLLGRMVLLADIGRQVRTMSILMRSGVHLLDTVAISARVLQNTRVRQSISGLAAGLRRGERLSAALAKSEYMPKLVVRMLAVGEETGDTDLMLARVADRYDDELRQSIKRALAWFEPLIIIVLGLMVGAIVMSLFMSVLDIQRSF